MTVVRADRIEVQDRLAEMGLTVEELHEVLTRVEAEGQATIPGLPADLTEDADEDDSLATWVLLYVHEKGEDQTKLRCELSLPLEIGAQGKINKWSERLILPPLEFPEDVIGLGGTEDDEGPGAIDVPIERRGA